MLVPIFESGINERRQYAKRADGQWFRRWQERDASSRYRWTRWMYIDFCPVNGAAGSPVINSYAGSARLPRN